jgi:hypothetical protein
MELARFRDNEGFWNGVGPRKSQSPPPPCPSPPPPEPIQPNTEAAPPPRKKVVFINFGLDSFIPESLPLFPARFATDKIKSIEYAELWYFTTEGILNASKISPAAADDAYGLTHADSRLDIQPVKALRTSRNVISDEALSWEQIATARHNLLDAKSGWPEKHRLALAKIFMNLEVPKAAGSNPLALILYQASARRRWHETFKGLSAPFNLANISKPLLLTLKKQNSRP